MLNIKSSHTQSKYLSHCPSAVVLFYLSAPPVPLLFISLHAVSLALVLNLFSLCLPPLSLLFCENLEWLLHTSGFCLLPQVKSSRRKLQEASQRQPFSLAYCFCFASWLRLCLWRRLRSFTRFFFCLQFSPSLFWRGSWPVHITNLCFRHDELTENISVFTLTFGVEVCICVRVCL